jgi:hypothetical protein
LNEILQSEIKDLRLRGDNTVFGCLSSSPIWMIFAAHFTRGTLVISFSID